MDIVSAIVVYLSLWWLIFYMSLPFGVSKSNTFTEGHERGAPHKTHLGLKLICTTLIAGIILVLIVYIIKTVPFSFE